MLIMPYQRRIGRRRRRGERGEVRHNTGSGSGLLARAADFAQIVQGVQRLGLHSGRLRTRQPQPQRRDRALRLAQKLPRPEQARPSQGDAHHSACKPTPLSAAQLLGGQPAPEPSEQ